jgi:WD40 repeat protein
LVRFTHHNKCILCASNNENIFRIMYWSLYDNTILCSFIGHEDQITSLDVNPASSTFVSVSRDGVARVWDYEKKRCLAKFKECNTANFDSSGTILAALYVKPEAKELVQQVHLFHTEDYQQPPFQIFSIEKMSEVKRIRFSFDNKQILLGSDQNELIAIDAKDGRKLSSYYPHP